METINIVDYNDDFKENFKQLNYEWITKSFKVETTDRLVLSNPVESIISQGGFIFFAKCNNVIVGTYALIKINAETFEIAKMAVTKEYQNRGIGKLLLESAIQKAIDLNITKLVLYTHSDLTVAIKMYLIMVFDWCLKMIFIITAQILKWS